MVYMQSEKNGLGTASLVLGILGTVFGLVPFVGWVALPLSAVGLGLGLGNLPRLQKNVATNKGVTWVGIGLSVLGIVLSILGLVVITAAITSS